MMGIYSFEAIYNANIEPAKEVKWFEVQETQKYWHGYLVQIGSAPATFHFSIENAIDWINQLEAEHGMDTTDMVIRSIRMPPLEEFIRAFLNTYGRKEVNLEFGRESK